MKRQRRIMALALALVLALALSAPAWADRDGVYSDVTVTVTVNGNSRSNFSCIQIFSGTQAIDGNDDNPMGDIQWGSVLESSQYYTVQSEIVAAVNSILGLTESDPGYLRYSPSFLKPSMARQVAEQIATMNEQQASELARRLYQICRVEHTVVCWGLELGENKMPVGYYLVFESIEQGGINNNSEASNAKNAALLQMTRNITITTKTDAPVQEKKVQENTKYQANDTASDYLQNGTDSSRTYGMAFNDTADYNIGDTVPFELLSKVPDMTYYTKYKFMFTDVMSQGLTLNTETNNGAEIPSITITIGGKTLTYGTDFTVSETAVPSYPGLGMPTVGPGLHAVAIDFQNSNDTDSLGLLYLVQTYMEEIMGEDYHEDATLSDVAGYPIRVEINATLNEKAGIAGHGNNQYGWPNVNISFLTYSSHPDYPDRTDDTIIDIVKVYTYALQIRKMDGTAIELPESGVTYYMFTETDGFDVIFDQSKIDDAIYAVYAGKAYWKVDGKWYLATPLEGAQFCLKAVTGEHAGKYVTVDSNNRVSGWLDTQPAASTKAAEEAKAEGVFITGGGNNGLIRILGLDDGTYQLVELKAPAGYNSLSEPVELKISADTSNGQNVVDSSNAYASIPVERGTVSLTMGGVTETFTYPDHGQDVIPGAVEAKILNNSGAVLPSTGGIGTTIFYVVGGVMVAAALILLITKKRVREEN